MKKVLTTIMLAALIIIAGCTDLDDIYRQLDEQKKELASVKQLINAMSNKISVVSYKELDDKSGYELTMSDGNKIILKHGAKGEQGEQGEQGAPGQDGDANLTITVVGDVIIIVYKGVTYTLPKEPTNPLSLVAEYNVNPAGDGFVTNLTDCTVSGYFNFDDAVSKFSDITIGGKRYHLPSIEEWQSIVPRISDYVVFIVETTDSYDDISETVTVQGTSITMTSDFRTGVNGVSYALRYKGTSMVSAWRYEYIKDGNNTHMKVTSRSLKGQTGVTVDDVAKPAFWSANAGNDVTRHFPVGGYSDSGSLIEVRTEGYYWSSSSYNSVASWSMHCNMYRAYSLFRGVTYGFSVRLFAS